jgi:hypothetical protein
MAEGRLLLSPFDLCFGDVDIVVAWVVAVRGLSVEPAMAAADEGGSLPVSSSFLILDLRSSSSSHTVDGAVVEMVDSVLVCSCIRKRSANKFSEASLDR